MEHLYQLINILDYDSQIVDTFAIEELINFLDYNAKIVERCTDCDDALQSLLV